jgi:hypothetical protein
MEVAGVLAAAALLGMQSKKIGGFCVFLPEVREFITRHTAYNNF